MAQFGSSRVVIKASALETAIQAADMRKPLSELYRELFAITPPAVRRCRGRWVEEVPDLDGDDWDDMWSSPFAYLVSARDRLIHFKFLHRIYYTPARLARIYRAASAECWRCSHSPADFSHVFWGCPVVKDYWASVLACIVEVVKIPVPSSVEVCLLGLVDGLAPARAVRTLVSLLLFYARKALLLHWKSPLAPTILFWKGLVNKVTPLYKATYLSRGCPRKFNKVWKTWIDSPASTSVDQL